MSVDSLGNIERFTEIGVVSDNTAWTGWDITPSGPWNYIQEGTKVYIANETPQSTQEDDIREKAIDEAALVCFEFSHKFNHSLETIEALQEVCGILRTRLKRGSMKFALKFLDRLPEQKPAMTFEQWATAEPERAKKIPLEKHANGAYVDSRSYLISFGWKSALKYGSQDEEVAKLKHERDVFRACLEGQGYENLDDMSKKEDAVEFARQVGELQQNITKDLIKKAGFEV